MKYPLTRLSEPGNGCWYKVPLELAEQLYNDERFAGELVHLYDDSEDGCESLIQNEDDLDRAMSEAIGDHTPMVVFRDDVYAQSELFEIREVINND